MFHYTKLSETKNQFLLSLVRKFKSGRLPFMAANLGNFCRHLEFLKPTLEILIVVLAFFV